MDGSPDMKLSEELWVYLPAAFFSTHSRLDIGHFGSPPPSDG